LTTHVVHINLKIFEKGKKTLNSNFFRPEGGLNLSGLYVIELA